MFNKNLFPYEHKIFPNETFLKNLLMRFMVKKSELYIYISHLTSPHGIMIWLKK